MYDINVKKSGLFVLFIIMGGLIGAIVSSFFINSFYSKAIVSSEFDASTVSTNVYYKNEFDDEGKEIKRLMYVYYVEGEEYVCSGWASNIDLSTKNDTVYYQSNNPSSCRIKPPLTIHIFFWVIMIVPLLFIIVPIWQSVKEDKRLKPLKILNQKGKLVKNIPYRVAPSEAMINGDPVPCPVVDYTLPNGSTIVLYGKPKFDFKLPEEDNFIDLVIDEENPTNYYMDYNINRILGNLPTDYYRGNTKNGGHNGI